jgi:hypothetical protein
LLLNNKIFGKPAPNNPIKLQFCLRKQKTKTMKRNTLYYLLPVLGILLFAGCTKDKPFTANTVWLGGQLSGAQEVPARATDARGDMKMSLDLDTKVLTYEIAYYGITPVAGHFHRGPGGGTGPVEITFTDLETPIRGQVTLTDAQVAGFQTGQYYANLHTTKFPGGEIRGIVQYITKEK